MLMLAALDTNLQLVVRNETPFYVIAKKLPYT